MGARKTIWASVLIAGAIKDAGIDDSELSVEAPDRHSLDAYSLDALSVLKDVPFKPRKYHQINNGHPKRYRKGK